MDTELSERDALTNDHENKETTSDANYVDENEPNSMSNPRKMCITDHEEIQSEFDAFTRDVAARVIQHYYRKRMHYKTELAAIRSKRLPRLRKHHMR